MPTYRFSWDAFDQRTVAALAADIGFRGPAEGGRAYLNSRVRRPNDDFVRATKNSLATVWLSQHAGVGAAIVRELFDRQIGPMGAIPTDAEGFGRYVARCRNSVSLRDLLCKSLISFGDKDLGRDSEISDDFVPRFSTVEPGKQPISRRRPYPHQTEAWAALDAHLQEAHTTGVFRGILVMPTGAGKSHTAADWLLRNWIDTGGRVLWLAHRDELLRQAARTFFANAALASNRARLRIRLVSGLYCSFHQIDPADDVVLCSIGSLARNLAHAEHVLQDPKVFVVIDEAHHAPAKSYRDTIQVLTRSAAHRLLGLTATPTRTAEDERPELSRLFGNRVLYQVAPGELIARELLARPIVTSVSTGIDAEKEMTFDDREHLRDFHELSSEMRARLGRNEHRNLLVVKQYLGNRAKYGKTLVFTTDVEGACSLSDAFRSRLPEQVEAAYVASYRPDGKADDPTFSDVLQRFRDPNSGLDVLINVEMLTEGVDLPMTRTVFLARPTSSEVLLRQMIGRALRGPAAGGHKEAYIVSFEDHWSEFRDVLSPMELLSDAVSVEEPHAPAQTSALDIGPQRGGVGLTPASWEHILAFSRAIRASVPDPDVDVFEAVPHGMFVLDYEVEGEAVYHVIHVYDHQRTCWDALLSLIRGRTPVELDSMDARALEADLFGDCEPPLPSALDIESMVARIRHGDAVPSYVQLEGRADCDPHELARLARDTDLRGSEVQLLLAERHTPLARVIYPTAIDFRRAFDDARRELEFPGEAPPPKGTVLFEPPPSSPLRPGPHHDLPKLFAEMLATGGRLLGQSLQQDARLGWSKRIIKGWFGKAFRHGEWKGSIRINCLLDSPDFSEDTLRFLLWHEFLHIHLNEGHTENFRRQERLWPNHASCNREMDSLHEKFGVQYW